MTTPAGHPRCSSGCADRPHVHAMTVGVTPTSVAWRTSTPSGTEPVDGVAAVEISVFGQWRGGSHRHHDVVDRMADRCGVGTSRIGEEGLVGGTCDDSV